MGYIGSYGIGYFSFSTTAPWLSLVAVHVGEPNRPEYDVTVTAEAGALEPGVHEGWIEVESPWCYECEKILFTAQPAPPAVQVGNWGRLKSRFRH